MVVPNTLCASYALVFLHVTGSIGFLDIHTSQLSADVFKLFGSRGSLLVGGVCHVLTGSIVTSHSMDRMLEYYPAVCTHNVKDDGKTNDVWHQRTSCIKQDGLRRSQ